MEKDEALRLNFQILQHLESGDMRRDKQRRLKKATADSEQMSIKKFLVILKIADSVDERGAVGFKRRQPG